MPGIAELLPQLAVKKAKTDFVVIVSAGNDKGEKHAITKVIGYNEGYALRYKNGDNKLDTVYVDRNFRFLELEGKFYLGKRLGNNSGCQINIDGETIQASKGIEVIGAPRDPNCPGEDLSALIRTDVMALGYNTITESKINVKWVLIIGGIVAVIALIYWFVKSRGGP